MLQNAHRRSERNSLSARAEPLNLTLMGPNLRERGPTSVQNQGKHVATEVISAEQVLVTRRYESLSRINRQRRAVRQYRGPKRDHCEQGQDPERNSLCRASLTWNILMRFSYPSIKPR